MRSNSRKRIGEVALLYALLSALQQLRVALQRLAIGLRARLPGGEKTAARLKYKSRMRHIKRLQSERNPRRAIAGRNHR